MDWGLRRDSAQGLDAAQPTLARDYSSLPGDDSNLGAGLARGGGEPTGQGLTLAAIRVT